jgi:hypothetical protein
VQAALVAGLVQLRNILLKFLGYAPILEIAQKARVIGLLGEMRRIASTFRARRPPLLVDPSAASMDWSSTVDGLNNISGGFLGSLGYPRFTIPAVTSPSSSRDQPAVPLDARITVEAATLQLFDKNKDQRVDERDAIDVFMQMARQFQAAVSKNTETTKVTQEREKTLRVRYEEELARQRTVVETLAKAEAPDEGEKVEANVVGVVQPSARKTAQIDLTV